MDPTKQSPSHAVELLTDPTCAKDIIKGILHTIFFLRTFTPVRPLTRDVLDTTLMLVDDADLESQIDARATTAVRELESLRGVSVYSAATLTVHIYLTERRRKNKPGYFSFSLSKPAEEEFIWESWAVKVSMMRAQSPGEELRLREKMERSVREAAFRITELADGEKEHIPPITTTEPNPFPYRIVVGQAVRVG